LDTSLFYPDSSHHKGICKTCVRKKALVLYYKNPELSKKRAILFYKAHREEIRSKARKDHAERRKKAIAHYGGKCACCGETAFEFLTIDHIEGHGTQHRKEHGGDSATNFYLWLEKNNYPKGFQVLCWNCNCSKGVYGFCPHKH
jgi:hypothetical protein